MKTGDPKTDFRFWNLRDRPWDMSSKRSRWDEEEEDAEVIQKKKEKEEKKKAKLAKKLQETVQQAEPSPSATPPGISTNNEHVGGVSEPSSRAYTPSKRRRISPPEPQQRIFPLEPPELVGCRSVEIYEKLNHIEEGSYGIVYRARDKETGDIVALKRLKLEREKNGFPITSLREISTLKAARHSNIVNIREVVMGESLSQYSRAPIVLTSRVFIVMDFIEHDLKALMEDMREPFLQSEVKTLMLQLLSATALMHDLWIVHRDLKTSNLLMTNRGMIKIADFGLARYFGDPVVDMTQLVVTLWYRAPELLLGTKEYGTEIDIWSIGCIFGELCLMEPLLQGKSEIDQLAKVDLNTFTTNIDLRISRRTYRGNMADISRTAKFKEP
jgi:cell division cycle 2-like